MIGIPDEPESVDSTAVANAEKMRLGARSIAFGSLDGFLAFGFGSGLSRRAPGTMGTLTAIPCAVLLSKFDLNGVVFLLLTFGLGIWICDRVSRRLGTADYGGIVWDEMVGFWLIALFLPLHWAWYLAGFTLFRAFDIFKPWPISRLEKVFKGGFGIMLDDILAALYTILILFLAGHVVLAGW